MHNDLFYNCKDIEIHMQHKLREERLRETQQAREKLTLRIELARKDDAHLASSGAFEEYKELLMQKIALSSIEKRILLSLPSFTPIKKDNRENRPKKKVK